MSTREARLRSILGERLRATRLARGITQRRVAELAKLDLKHYGAIERGQRNISLGTLTRLAAALKVEPWELLHPPGVVAGAEVPEAERIAALLERIDDRQRDAVLRVLEGFAPFRAEGPRPRPRRTRKKRTVGP